METKAAQYQTFKEHSLTFLSAEEQQQLLQLIDKNESAVSIRYNPFKPTERQGQPVPWCSQANYLSAKPSFTLDPLLHAGAYYVQEASSMSLELFFKNLDLPDQATILDLCASPGGKSTHLLGMMKPSQLLVSNELIKTRIAGLKENLIKWGCENIVLTNNDSSDFTKLGPIFDMVLVDAPCSGEGLFRKDPNAIDHWSAANVEVCWKRQQRILADIIPTIKSGGYLIYATCTYNKLEDEQNMAWLLENFAFEEIKWTTPPHGVLACEHGYKFLPTHIAGEGFYICCLQKYESPGTSPKLFSRKSKFDFFKNRNQIAPFFLDNSNVDFYSYSGIIKIFSPDHKQMIDYLASHLHIITAGLDVAEWLKMKEILPSHSLCLNRYFNKSAFAPVELGLHEAQLFLKKELQDIDCGNGLHVATYMDLPIGFFKKINNRINNQYPQEWRIRMALA